MTAPSPQEVLVTAAGPVLVITLNRPHRRNAVNRAVSQAVAAAIDRLDADDQIRVGILTGAGGSFCSGMDLKAFAAGEPTSSPSRGFGGLARRPPEKPLIAAVEGHAVGGGLELALACDLVIAGRSAKFGLPEVKRGLAATSGGLFRLPSRIPLAVALEMALTGEPIGAERAYELGLVNRLVDDGDAVTVATEVAGVIAANAPLALAASKKVMLQSRSWPPAEAFDRQAPFVDGLRSTEDAREGALAFVQRRAPVWKGR